MRWPDWALILYMAALSSACLVLIVLLFRRLHPEW